MTRLARYRRAAIDGAVALEPKPLRWAVFDRDRVLNSGRTLVSMAPDLALLAFGALLLAGLILADATWVPLQLLQIALGAMFVLVAPGYALAAAVFPRASDLETVERLGISVGASVAIIALLSVLLDRLGVGLHFAPVVLSTYLLIGLLSSVAVWRRVKLATGGASGMELTGSMFGGLSGTRWNPRLTAVAVVGGLAAAGVAFALSDTPADLHSEFFVLNRDGVAAFYPTETSTEENVEVLVGVSNNEGRAVNYRVEVVVADTGLTDGNGLLVSSAQFQLAPGESHLDLLSWRMPHAGDNQQVHLLLFRDVDERPSHQLMLWLDVY